MVSIEHNPTDHPSSDSSQRFALDFLLRKHGYRIYSRVSGQLPVWERSGEKLDQDEALQSLIPKEVKAARQLEDDYYEKLLNHASKN